MKKVALLAAILIGLGMLTGCPADVSPPPPNTSTVTGVTVEPNSANVNQGHERTFTALVSGTGSFPQTVTWSIVQTDKKAGTAITADGVLTVAADEVVGKELTIRANSTLAGYTHIHGDAAVTVKDANAPEVTGITVTPATANVNQGGNATFTAEVTGTGNYPETVTWSIVEADKKAETVIVDGVLTVAADEVVGKELTIRANSTLAGYTDVHGDAIVTVIDPNAPSDKIWLVGDISDWLVGPKQPIELTEETDGTFTWSGNLTTGYLKFSKGSEAPADWTGVWLTPPENSAVAVDCEDLNDPDSLPFETGANKENGSWQIVNSGAYTITINLEDSTVEFVRTGDLGVAITDIWLASSLASNWNPPFTDPQWKFTKKLDGTFIWTGTFTNPTYFRFYTLSADESGNYFMPTVNDTVVSAKDAVTPMPGFAPSTSNSWRWTSTEEISIVIDPAAKTFIITDPEPAVTQIILAPPTANVEQGKTREFNATVHGQGSYPHTVTWSIVETDKKTGTDIDTDGELTVAEDEAVDKTLTIQAHSTLAGYTHIYGEATVTVIAPVLVGTVDNVIIYVDGEAPQGQVEVERGYTQQFTVYVEALGGASEEVNWSIVETAAAGTAIDSSGLLTINVAEGLPVLTIKATSVYDNNQFDTVQVKVCRTEIWFASNHNGMTQWWHSDTGGGGPAPDERKFIQMADGTYAISLNSTSTTFYFRFVSRSTLTGSTERFYRAPTSNAQVTLNTQMAMADFDTTQNSWRVDRTSGNFTIILDPSIHNTSERYFIFSDTTTTTVTKVEVSPAAITISQGANHPFSATVTGANSPSQDVTWTIDGAGDGGTTTAAGSTINSGGLLSVSGTEPIGANLTIRATSTVANYTHIFGTATVTVRAAATSPIVYSVAISPSANVEVQKGKTQQFTAVVDAEGGADDGVNWSIVESVAAGTNISTTGLLTIDENETAATITVRATPKESGFANKADEVTVTIKAAGIDMSPGKASSTVRILGDATGAGWSAPGNPLYDQGDNVFAWYGKTSGQFRITVNGTNHGAAAYANVNLSNGGSTTVSVISGGNQSINLANNATYNIWFYLDELKVVIERVGD